MTCQQKTTTIKKKTKKKLLQQSNKTIKVHCKVCTRFFWFPSCQVEFAQMDKDVQRFVLDFIFRTDTCQIMLKIVLII